MFWDVTMSINGRIGTSTSLSCRKTSSKVDVQCKCTLQVYTFISTSYLYLYRYCECSTNGVHDERVLASPYLYPSFTLLHSSHFLIGLFLYAFHYPSRIRHGAHPLCILARYFTTHRSLQVFWYQIMLLHSNSLDNFTGDSMLGAMRAAARGLWGHHPPREKIVEF